eukprot:2844500-Amphidinium_carterae.1
MRTPLMHTSSNAPTLPKSKWIFPPCLRTPPTCDCGATVAKGERSARPLEHTLARQPDMAEASRVQEQGEL